MADDIRKLKNRIRSVDSTAHLTRAMGLVASGKMRKALKQMRMTQEYSDSFSKAISVLLKTEACMKSVYYTGNGSKKSKLIVIAGDRGMAGGYNANVFRLAASLPADEVLPIGRRASSRYEAEQISSERFSAEEGLALMKCLCVDYEQGRFGKLQMVFTRYYSMLHQETALITLLPFKDTDFRKENDVSQDVLFEPDAQTVLQTCVPEYLTSILMRGVRESFASETAARKTAMDSAGRNAQLMMDDLTLQFNRARQNAITQEITEIVAGSGS